KDDLAERDSHELAEMLVPAVRGRHRPLTQNTLANCGSVRGASRPADEPDYRPIRLLLGGLATAGGFVPGPGRFRNRNQLRGCGRSDLTPIGESARNCPPTVLRPAGAHEDSFLARAKALSPAPAFLPVRRRDALRRACSPWRS